MREPRPFSGFEQAEIWDQFQGGESLSIAALFTAYLRLLLLWHGPVFGSLVESDGNAGSAA